MVFLMHNLSNYLKNARKGQFFVLTALAIVTILFFISRWVEPTQIDTSSIVLSGEFYTFDNLREKTANVIKNSQNCDDLNYNLQEYDRFVDDIALERNYRITFNYTIPSCSDLGGAMVGFTLRIQTAEVDARDDFQITWP